MPATDASLLCPYGTMGDRAISLSTDASLLCPYGTQVTRAVLFATDSYRRFAVVSLRDDGLIVSWERVAEFKAWLD